MNDNNYSSTNITNGSLNCRMKQFGNDYLKLTIFNKCVFKKQNKLNREQKKTKDKENCKEGNKKTKSKENKQKIERIDSIKRAKDKCYEIAYANQFEYFVTLTIDESKLSRTESKEILKAIKSILSNLVQRKNLKYLLIPEYHKKLESDDKRAIHFHGLISGTNLMMQDSGKKYQGTIPILNWLDWKYGFSTAIPLDNRKHICQYVTKYITKDTDKIFGKRYFTSGNLIREVPTSYFLVDYNAIDAKEYVVEKVPSIKVKYLTLDINEEVENESYL